MFAGRERPLPGGHSATINGSSWPANRRPRNGAWRSRYTLERPPALHGRTAPIGGRLCVTPLDLTDAEFATAAMTCRAMEMSCRNPLAGSRTGQVRGWQSDLPSHGLRLRLRGTRAHAVRPPGATRVPKSALAECCHRGGRSWLYSLAC
jgi:hypothetical protein